MLGIVLTWVGYTLLGATLVVGAIFGAAWYLAKEINAGHGRGCSCPACQARRQRQWRARHPAWDDLPPVNQAGSGGQWEKDRKPPPTRSEWVSTLELQPGMRVHGTAGKIFLVKSVTRISYGYLVVLVNALSDVVSRIPIEGDKASHRIWLVRRPRGDAK